MRHDYFLIVVGIFALLDLGSRYWGQAMNTANEATQLASTTKATTQVQSGVVDGNGTAVADESKEMIATAGDVRYIPFSEQDEATRQLRQCRITPDDANRVMGFFKLNTFNEQNHNFGDPLGSRDPRARYAEALRCLGIFPEDHAEFRDSLRNPSNWDHRIPDGAFDTHFPTMIPMHGAVSPTRLTKQGYKMADLMGVAHYSVAARAAIAAGGLGARDAAAAMVEQLERLDGAGSDATQLPRDVIVELGCGNGGLLFMMCPPVAAVACFGVDFAPRPIRHAQRHMPHIDFRVDVAAPHVPTGAATAVLSHAVMTYLTEAQACGHIREMLRLLRPGGRAVMWMLIQKPFGTRFHPSFFEEVIGGQRRVLQFCRGLASYVRNVTLVMQDTDIPIYTATGVYFGAVLERSDAKFRSSGTVSSSTLPLEAHRRRVAGVEPLIPEPEGVHRYAHGNVSLLQHYVTMVNSSAVHQHRRKVSRGGYYWGVHPAPGGRRRR